MTIQELADTIHNTICDMDNEDENIERLEKAMQFFCGTWDKCEGFKHALHLTLDDQTSNHLSEQDVTDYVKLLEILTK
jgi:hypothetical protein